VSCRGVKLEDGSTATVCTRGRSQRCKFCREAATRLCDAMRDPRQLGPTGCQPTCDNPICDDCAKNLGPDRDVCPDCRSPELTPQERTHIQAVCEKTHGRVHVPVGDVVASIAADDDLRRRWRAWWRQESKHAPRDWNDPERAVR